jgi:hypothetical protein
MKRQNKPRAPRFRVIRTVALGLVLAGGAMSFGVSAAVADEAEDVQVLTLTGNPRSQGFRDTFPIVLDAFGGPASITMRGNSTDVTTNSGTVLRIPQKLTLPESRAIVRVPYGNIDCKPQGRDLVCKIQLF